MTATRRLQELVIRTSPWPPFRWAYAGIYAAALAWLVARLRRVPEIRSVELRPPRRGHCFGSSDLDLRALTGPLSAREFFAFADRLARVLLPGGTWLRLFDLYAFPEAEYALQSMVVAQSVVRDRRWVRLLGRPPATIPAHEHPDAYLGRATYEHAALCQQLFETRSDLHQTRVFYSRVLRIDAEARARHVATEHDALRLDVVAAAQGPALRGRVRPTSFDVLARAHFLASTQITALARDALAAAPRAENARALALVEPAVAPETLAAAAMGTRPPVAELCEAAGGAIRSALLAAVPGTRFDYRICLVTRDDLAVEEHVELCRKLRALFVGDDPRVPYQWFRMRFPVLLTPAVWRASGRWFHGLRSLEEHYACARYGVVLWGDDCRAEVVPPDPAAVARSAALGVADLRNRIWGALHHGRPKYLADLLAGRLPALWLVLARGIIATSPGEAVAGCVEAGFPHADVLAALHARLTALRVDDVPPVDDALWRPALDALTGWLDELAALALAALRTRSAPPQGGA